MAVREICDHEHVTTVRLTGIPGSPGRSRGRAAVLSSAADFETIRRGEILVTRFATPDVVLVFDRIAALVTDQGGRSAHSVVVARELGIPVVVGTQTATRDIPHGASVMIDGDHGTIEFADGEADSYDSATTTPSAS